MLSIGLPMIVMGDEGTLHNDNCVGARHLCWLRQSTTPVSHDFIERLGTPRPARAGADAARVEAPVAGLRRKSGRLWRQASASERLVFRGRNHGKRPLRAAAAAYVIEAGSVSERSHGGEAA